ncbi:MAG: hypothetical protein ABW068_13935 [Candidatus Thiodiazotropha sp.]
MTLLGESKPTITQQTGTLSGEKKFDKQIHSADQAIFPRTQQIKMPQAEGASSHAK